MKNLRQICAGAQVLASLTSAGFDKATRIHSKKRNEHASRLGQTKQARLTRVEGISSQSGDQKRRFLS